MTPDSSLIAISDFKDPHSSSPHSSSPHKDSDWQPVHDGSDGTSPPTSFSCLCYRLENFLPLEINLLWKKKKVSLPSELIFPSNILEEKCWWWNVCRWGGYQTLGVRQCSTQSNYPDVLHSNLSKWNVVKNLINNFLGGKKSLRLVSLLVSLISHPVFHPSLNKTWKVESMWKALTLMKLSFIVFPLKNN